MVMLMADVSRKETFYQGMILICENKINQLRIWCNMDKKPHTVQFCLLNFYDSVQFYAICVMCS